MTLKACITDFNWVQITAEGPPRASMAHEFAGVDPHKVVDWQLAMGANMIVQHAFTFNGCAWYPTRLGPEAPIARSGYFGRLFNYARNAGVKVCGYMCVGQDKFTCAVRPDWLVPTTSDQSKWWYPGFLAPESGWTDLLCGRIEEFLALYPVDAMLFDWFVYGTTTDWLFPVQPTQFVRGPFKEIIGRDMPEKADQITTDESLRYQREVLARQFFKIRDAVKRVHPQCAIMFNVPYWKPHDPKWIDHPMIRESDWLFAESSQLDVVDWLLEIRRPEQRVFSTIISGIDQRHDPERWKLLHARGCDLIGWGFPDPATLIPGPWYEEDFKIIRNAFNV